MDTRLNTRSRQSLTEIRDTGLANGNDYAPSTIFTTLLVDDPFQNIIEVPDSFPSPPHLSPDEHIINLRGRKQITWSPHHDEPLNSPLKTPTKKMSAMQLRSSPRKRLLTEFCETTPERQFNTPVKKSNSVSRKKIRFDDSAATSRLNPDIPLNRLLKGLSHEQLIDVVMQTVRNEPKLDKDIRMSLPAPDLRPLEDNLLTHRRNISRSLPKTRLVSKTDTASYTRVAPYLEAFKQCLFEQLKNLSDSAHWDALLDFVQIAWVYVKATPVWDNAVHNKTRKLCFKQLMLSASAALKNGGIYLGERRLVGFSERLRSMTLDCDEKGLLQQIQDLLDTTLNSSK